MGNWAATLEERWRRVWAAMRSASYGSIIVAGRGTIGEYGWLQFITGVFPTTRVWYAVLHLDSPPLLVVRSVAESNAVDKEAWASIPRRVVNALGVEYAAAVGEIVRYRPGGRIGIVGADSVGQASWIGLTKALGEWPENVEELLRPIRLIKSERDFDELRSAAGIADSGVQFALDTIRTGISERELATGIEAAVRAKGAQLALIHVSRGIFSASRATQSAIEREDVVSVLVEVSSETGYWVEIGIALAMSEAQRSVPMALQCIAALTRGADALGSGRNLGFVAESMRAALGKDWETAIGLGHGVGIDEEPSLVLPGSPDQITRGAAFALHPSANDLASAQGCAVANTFLVDGSNAEAVSALPMELHFVDS